MIDAILTAMVLGFFAGAVPGPYTTVVASTALERGFRPALRLALVPIVTDFPPMIIMSMILDRVNFEVLTVVGMVGGLLFAILGFRFIVRQGAGFEDRMPEVKEGRAFWTLASAGLLSPAPWIFWLVAASPLLLRQWNQYWLDGVVFAFVLFLMLIGTATALAWGASHGHRVLDPRIRRRVLRTTGAFLIVAGGVMIWQSWEGNFQRMVQQQERLLDRVGGGRHPEGDVQRDR